MINKEDIYRASNKGLDIIKALYPDARRIIDAGKLKEAFKMRLAEKTASAHLKEKETCWIVTDFGDDQRPRNPIDLWMKEKNLSFYEAIVDINTQLQLGVLRAEREVHRAGAGRDGAFGKARARG